MDFEQRLACAIRAAHEAGDKILKVFDSGVFGRREKDGGEPLGEADLEANVTICTILHSQFPQYGILTEEVFEEKRLPKEQRHKYEGIRRAIEEWRERERVWVIDPVDGTKQFLAGIREFGVHIGLVDQDQAVLGVNCYPTLAGNPDSDAVYTGVRGEGAYVRERGKKSRRLSVSDISDFESMRFIITRSEPEDIIKAIFEGESIPPTRITRMGGMGIKLCKIADGDYDICPELHNRASIWDTCSGQVILTEAGGKITDGLGNKINYRPEGSIKIEKGVFASNGPGHDLFLPVMQKYL